MKKTLYLHIGNAKTGTTALQRFLSDQRDWLRERGYLVPKSEFYNHRPLAQSIIMGFTDHRPALNVPGQDDCESLWKQLREEIDASDCPVILVSSENFRDIYRPNSAQQSNTMIRWLGNQLKDLDVRIVCYLRPLDSHVKSEYKQAVKDGRRVTSPLSWFLEKKISLNDPIVSPTSFLDIFASQFGAENLILRKFTRHQLVNGNIVDDFLELVGLPAQNNKTSTRLDNPSLPNELVDIKRIFNSLADVSPSESARIGTAMAQQSTTVFDAYPINGGETIREALQVEHRKIANNYGLDLGEVDDPFSDAQTCPIEARGQAVLISELYKQVRESHKALVELRSEVQDLRAENDKLASSHQIKKSPAHPKKFSRYFKGQVQRLANRASAADKANEKSR